jgi:acyl-CoA reductase-like NAD-dependent aldehyde dehydrogenase/nicotinamidase-related amidase
MKPALLLVDLQADFLSAPGLQPRPDALITRVAALAEGCRKRGIPVIHLWTTVCSEDDRRLPHWKQKNHWQCVAGTPGHKSPQPLQPREGEIIIHKTGFSGFINGELEAALRKVNCDSPVIAGLHLHACVRSAAVECLERGLQVFIAEDSVASNDPIHAAATRRWMAERCVRFDSTQSLLARFDGQRAQTLVHRSPRETEKVLFEVPISGLPEIKTATAVAQDAWTRWRNTDLPFRCELMAKVAERLAHAAAQLAPQLAIEIGKPVTHAFEEIGRAARNVQDVIQRAGAFQFDTHEPAGIVRRPPLGVVALISPWNNPVAIPIGKIVPALLYGNTVVWKPAPAANEIARRLLRLMIEAGVPADLIQLVTGDHTTAQLLATDENCDAVTFTGSLHGGHAVQEICARRMVPLQAELSGNNAAIVWDDADFQHAATQIASGAFGFAGQRCTANRRVVVSHRCFDQLLHELKTATAKMVWSDPLESKTDIGPLIHSSKRDELNAIVTAALADGGANRIEYPLEAMTQQIWTTAGTYAQPVIACCDQPQHVLVQEETMSPLLVIQQAADFDEALALNNVVRHGLAAALFSQRADLRRRFLNEAECGILRLNSSTAGADIRLPFGGWKESGLGPPEHGMADPLFVTRIQADYGAS